MNADSTAVPNYAPYDRKRVTYTCRPSDGSFGGGFVDSGLRLKSFFSFRTDRAYYDRRLPS